MKHKKTSSGCTLNSKKRFLFVFGYTNGCWSKFFKGFTHVGLIQLLPNGLNLIHDPMISHMENHVLHNKLPIMLPARKVIEVTIKPTLENKMLGFKFQTCATIIQYLAGISLGCILVQSLYDKLTGSSMEWLNSKGILKVTEWA